MKTFLVACLFFPVFLFGQKTHTVGPKETLFSIGRKYQVHPRELASFNQIPYEAGLTVGQVLKIPSKTSMTPLAATSAPQPVQQPAAQTASKVYESVPVYHTVAKKETLFQISKKTKASIPDIRKWNHLTGDALKEGMQLVIGYKKEPRQAETASTMSKAAPVPAPVKTATETPQPVAEPVSVKPAAPPVTEVSKVATSVETPAEPVKPATASAPAPVVSGESFFKSAFDEQVTGKATLKERTGQAGSFKSGSGWQDGKYYCLYNQAAPGTIIKVTNTKNQQVIYAKVLDVIPDMKQNNGLLILISNSAATRLGSADTLFECSVSH
ncbi:MAG: LysM peptidoglycan-binding domain-containing protein [Ferruginibacter sp.]